MECHDRDYGNGPQPIYVGTVVELVHALVDP
jgi:hypothetical protein